MLRVKVDGVEIEVPQGATVLQACGAAGKEIPRFCYHERPRFGRRRRLAEIQGLIRHFRPEPERRIVERRALEAAE